MLSQERQQKIISILEKENSIKIIDIVKMFQISHETARRDLESLQEQGIAKRVYGGAILTADSSLEKLPSLSANNTGENGSLETLAIGLAASRLIHEGDTILLGMGTTVLETAKHLRDIKGISVLTNSISVLNELVDSDVNLYMLGGHVSSSEHHMEGQLALQSLQYFNVDIAIVGAGGITLDNGVSDYNYESAQMVQAMIKRAKQTILVARSSKFGKNSFSVACPLEEIDIIVTDRALSEQYIHSIHDLGIQLILAEDTL